MEILTENKDDFFVIKIVGRLDASTSNDLEEKVLEAIEDNGVTNMLINFDELEYISSSGLRVLLVAAKKLKVKSGIIKICGMKSHIREVFEIAGFTPLFTIEDNC